MTEEEEKNSLNSHKTYRRPMPPKDDKLKLRNLLNIIFMILAVLAIIIYLSAPAPKGGAFPYYFIVCCFVAVIVKGVEVCIRMTTRKNQKK